MAEGDWKEMFQAAVDGDLDLVKYHLRNGIDPNYQHPEILATPLVASILNGNDEISVYLIENGAEPHLKSYFDEFTPLEAAKKMKNESLIKILKEKL